MLQAVIGFSLLEVVNYMEHYGMLRQKVGPEGKERYERVNPSHSWNSNNIATNVLLYHLQRHSDHHANPTRRYQTLRDFKESPVLPTGYTGMIVLALIPPVYRRMMDKRVLRALRRRPPLWPTSHPPSGEDAGQVRPSRTTYPRARGDDIVAQAESPTRCWPRAARAASYIYQVAAGNEPEGFAAGTSWSDIPDDWCCPDCGVREKIDFVPVDPET